MAQHLESSPVAFAVTEGPTHALVYENAVFRRLLAAGEIAICSRASSGESATDLAPLLDRVFRGAGSVCEVPAPATGGEGRWSCSVWPINADGPVPRGLAMELHEAASSEEAIRQQRIVAERLLLAALREQDAAREAVEASRRATFLAAASRELAMSLDEEATRECVQRRVLPRVGTWCIVDVVEANGVTRRLDVVHPDPAKQSLAHAFAGSCEPTPGDPIFDPSVMLGSREPSVITPDSGAALLIAMHGPENLATLRSIGFAALLVIPLTTRAMVLGAITFVTPEGDTPLLPEEIALASDLADRCATALDNARFHHETETLRAAADAANRAKAVFLGTMSHELRTPLHLIGGYTELIELGLHGPVTPEQLADLGRIRHNQQHLITLITDVLNFARSESGRVEYHFSEVPVEAALRDVAEMLDGAIKERMLGLVGPADGAVGVVWADADRVRQILVNLVMNAVKYSSFASGTITLSSAVTSDAVIIHVADTGPGIPDDKLEAIFEPFVQLTAAPANRRGGVGLGLAISRDHARSMNGDLTVESTVGVGSRFTLTLPRARQSARVAQDVAQQVL